MQFNKYTHTHTHCCTVGLFFVPPPPPELCLYKCIEFTVHGTIPSVVCQNRMTAVLSVDPSTLPDLCLYKCIKFRVHGTISSMVCQNIRLYCCTVDPIFLPRYMPVQLHRVKGTLYNILCCVSKHTAVLLYYGSDFSTPTYACRTVQSLDYTVQYYLLCVKICLLLYCCTVDPFFSPRLMPKRKTFTRAALVCTSTRTHLERHRFVELRT